MKMIFSLNLNYFFTCLFRPATFVNVTFVLNQAGWSLTEKQELV